MESNLYLGDCLEVMKKIPDGSIDCIITDPPYWTTKCSWDSVIPFEPMWEQLKRIIKPNGAIVLFGSEPFSSALRMSNVKEYKYDWKWIKNNVTKFLSVDVNPLKSHEDILVFHPEGHLRDLGKFLKHKREEKGITKSKMDSLLNTNTLYSFFEGRKLRGETIYSIPNKQHWNILCDILGINKDDEIYPKDRVFNHINLEDTHKEISKRDKHREDTHYSFNANEYTQEKTNYSRDVLYFSQDKGRFHQTQKPVALIEYLIKTYTKEWETVLDFTAGSFTTAVASDNTNRKWICIEQDLWYCKIWAKRINENRLKLWLDILDFTSILTK